LQPVGAARLTIVPVSDRLSATGRTDKDQKLARFHLDIDVMQNLGRTVGFLELSGLKS